VITDPWVSVRPDAGGMERIAYQDLPEKIDFALITHAHHDHFVPETLLRLRHKIECLVVPRTHGLFYTDTSLKLMAKKLGFRNVVELDSLESIKLADGEIISVPFMGEHADLPHGKSAYIVRANDERILFAADSNCLDHRLYEHLRRILGDIETVFLGMECVGAPLSWLYGALLPTKLNHNQDHSRRTKGSDSKAALALLEAVGAKRVYIYAMGNEPWFQFGMGLGLSEDSVQIKEAGKVISTARERGFLDAQRPFGHFELALPQRSTKGAYS
jgi:L-ascorbate metabolism protein UlaG (beta-lactamase superfamily)